jgi:hypothetical protein
MKGAHMLPFSRDEFFTVFAAYNEAIWPAQAFGLALGALAIGALWLRPQAKGVVILGVLALLWGWTGVAYHMVFFAPVTGAALGFGAFFVVEALMLFVFALGRSALVFDAAGPNSFWGWMLILYAIVVYPLVGVLNGHVYPAAPTFGVTPCPLVIFTFGMLMFLRGRVPWSLLVIPLIWSVIGGSAAFLLGVAQDWMLPASGLLVVLLRARSEATART